MSQPLSIPGIIPPPKWLLDMESATTMESIYAVLPFGELGSSGGPSQQPAAAPVTVANGKATAMLPFDLTTTPQRATLSLGSGTTVTDVENTWTAQMLVATPAQPSLPVVGPNGEAVVGETLRGLVKTGAPFDIKLDSGRAVLEIKPNPWDACTTIAEFDQWKEAFDYNNTWPWEAFGAPTKSGALDPAATVQQIKDALNASPAIHWYEQANATLPASDVVLTHEKDPAATATDRKAIITVTIPADRIVGSWVMFYVQDQYVAGGLAEGTQAEQVKAGQTAVTFKVTWKADGTAFGQVFVGFQSKSMDTPSLTFP
jgi:hypothetical protein